MAEDDDECVLPEEEEEDDCELVGTNIDNTIKFLSPIAKLKRRRPCYDASSQECKHCPIVISPGAGAWYEEFERSDGQVDTNYNCTTGQGQQPPPYDFSRNPHLDRFYEKLGIRPPEKKSGQPNDYAYRNNQPRDWILTNAIEVANAGPGLHMDPNIVVDNHGNKMNWFNSGLCRNHVHGKNFGRIPRYLCCINDDQAKEDYRIKRQLDKCGDISCDPEDNRMNRYALLEMQYMHNPLVKRAHCYIKPNINIYK